MKKKYLVAFLANDLVGLEQDNKFQLDELNQQLARHVTSIEMILLRNSQVAVQL